MLSENIFLGERKHGIFFLNFHSSFWNTKRHIKYWVRHENCRTCKSPRHLFTFAFIEKLSLHLTYFEYLLETSTIWNYENIDKLLLCLMRCWSTNISHAPEALDLRPIWRSRKIWVSFHRFKNFREFWLRKHLLSLQTRNENSSISFDTPSGDPLPYNLPIAEGKHVSCSYAQKTRTHSFICFPHKTPSSRTTFILILPILNRTSAVGNSRHEEVILTWLRIGCCLE